MTSEDQAVLVRYVGWGGIPQAFDPANTDWRKEYEELLSLLPRDEYEEARRSTQDAHYTSTIVIDGIYAGIRRFGVEGGKVLEPSVGSGNFIGRMPGELRGKVDITGIELDPTTAKIAGFLYPNATVINKGFQEVNIPTDHFDVVVGNPPFGNQKVYDPAHKDLSDFSIHNYFIAKSLDKVRAGGIVGVVVSNYFLDAKGEAAREHIADHARLVGAIRLPNNAFKQNALTEVTTDIVFLQKLHEGETADKGWVRTGEMLDAETGKPFPVNQYFLDNPSMMLGEMRIESRMFRDQPALVAREGQDLAAELQAAVAGLPEGIYRRIVREVESKTELPPIELPNTLKIGAFFLTSDGKVARRLPDVLNDANYEIVEFKNEKAGERVKGMIEVRDTLRNLMTAERDGVVDEGELDTLRTRLNVVYDKFVKQYGFISSQVNKLAMSDDPEYPLLHALERDYDRGVSKDVAKKNGVEPREPSANKAAIFTKRVMSPVREITRVETAKDALVVSMNETGGVDIDLMVRLSGKPENVLVKELTGLMFLDPVANRWVTADKYLTGNVKDKLKLAESAAHTFGDAQFGENVRALRAVQPADIEPVDIAIQLGSTWVPPRVVDEFVTHLLGGVHRNINYQPTLGKWIAKIGRGDQTTTTATWGTPEAPANHIIECILGNKPVQVKEIVGYDDYRNPIYQINEEKTAAANQKADEIRTAFLDWVWTDKDRRESLARIYNDRFNTNVAPKYDGSHLTLPGSSLAITLRPHQKDAIWRGIQEGNTLFDHTVGAGKTMVCVGTAMESRRMGLLKKPMFVVPNHLLLQWKDAFYELYPNANILVAEKADFKKENREKLFGRIATGDWDAVIVAHSSFKKIGMPAETLKEILSEQIDDLTDAILEQKRERGDRVTIKEMEKARDRMKAKLERSAETGEKDKAVTFDDLGIDAIMVDEAQEYKNLAINTSLTRVSGLGNLAGSDKAFDLFVKARYLQLKQDGRGYFSATGTPVSNTIAEVYTVQRYHQYDEMKRRGIVHFDAWASTFGQVVTGWELDATGVNYKLNSRFAKFQNVPELISLYRTFADVITKQDLQRQAAERGTRFPVPKIKGGKPRNIVVERSEDQARYMGVQETVLGDDGKPIMKKDGTPVKQWTPGSIIHRMEHLPKDPSKDNPLKITNDARKAGLDFRLIDPAAPDHDGSKANTVAREVFRIYKEWDDRKGTQLVFCDLSTPKSAKSAPKAKVGAEVDSDRDEDAEEEVSVSMDDLLAGTSAFSVYDDLKAKLVAMGMPPNEVRFIHEADTDAKKAKLFDQMNRGEVRVLLGSTLKMGAGTNVQRRLVALHHVDAPWRPSDLEQRDGRIERQGNMFYAEDPDGFEVEILRYATKQTYDSRMWQTIEYKAAGIEQFRRGDSLQRVIDDVAGEAANSAEMKAAATGNPLIFQQVKLSADLKKLEAVRANFDRNQHRLQSRIEWLEEADLRAQVAIEAAEKAIAVRDANTSKEWRFETVSRPYTSESKDALLSHVLDKMKEAIDASQAKSARETRQPTVAVGKYRGFTVLVGASKGGSVHFALRINGKEYSPTNLAYHETDKFSVGGFIQRMDNVLDHFEEEITWATKACTAETAELAKARDELAKPFPQQAKLEMLRKDVSDVLVELKKIQNNPDYVSDWVPLSESDTAGEAHAAIEAARSASCREAPMQAPNHFADIAREVERLRGEGIAAIGHVNAVLVPAMAAKWSVPQEEALETFNTWLNGANRGEQGAPKSIARAGFHPDSIGRADAIVSQYLQAQREPLRASEILGSRSHDALFEQGDAKEIHQVLLARVDSDQAFAQAILSRSCKRYASAEMLERAEAATGLHDEAQRAAAASGVELQKTNRHEGQYTGKILFANDRIVLQDIGMRQGVFHHREDVIATTQLRVGESFHFAYRAGSAVIRDSGKQHDLGR